MTTCLNENLSSGKYQLNSMIQGVSRRAEEERSETSRDGQSRGIGSRKNIK